MLPVPRIMAPIAGAWVSLLGAAAVTGVTMPVPGTMQLVLRSERPITRLVALISGVETVLSAIPFLVARVPSLIPKL